MIVIGICEGQKDKTEELRKIIEEYCFRKKIKLSILRLYDTQTVDHIIKHIDILFCEINAAQINSNELKKEIHKENRKCKIITVSEKELCFREIFGVSVFRQIRKPFVRMEVEKAIEDAIKKVVIMDKIQFYKNRIPYEVSQRDIFYIKTYGSFIEAKIGNHVMRKGISLTKIEQILDPQIFFRLNRRCIVNLMKIDEYKNGVICIDDEKIVISRRRKKQFDVFFQKLKEKNYF